MSLSFSSGSTFKSGKTVYFSIVCVKSPKSKQSEKEAINLVSIIFEWTETIWLRVRFEWWRWPWWQVTTELQPRIAHCLCVYLTTNPKLSFKVFTTSNENEFLCCFFLIFDHTISFVVRCFNDDYVYAYARTHENQPKFFCTFYICKAYKQRE